MRVVGFSDTHCHSLNKLFDTVEKADLIIGAGDYLTSGSQMEWIRFLKDLESIRHKADVFYLIGGNHDKFMQSHTRVIRQNLADIGVDYLEDEGRSLKNIKFWGSPWVPPINDMWAWEFPSEGYSIKWGHDYRAKANEKWGLIPNNVDVLITHTPVADILAGPWGCKYLQSQVFQRIRPKHHLFGHVHGFGGKQQEFNGTKFYNLAICSDAYKTVNPVTEIEIEDAK